MNILNYISLHIDAIIFISFLSLNLIIGLKYARGISTIRSYSIGNKDFSTSTIVSTIVATCVSGSLFVTTVKEAYSEGLSFIIPAIIGDFLSLFIIGAFFAPRMKEFLNKLSIAEAMGDLYGRHVRIITAIAGFVGMSSGIIAIQLKISGLIFEYALGTSFIYGVIISGIIITLYSSLGGIKSVTFTDVIQFITFGSIIPIVAYFLFKGIENEKSIIDTLTNNPLFDFSNTFSISNPDKYYILFLFLWIVIPGFNPASFQRIAMAKDSKQASRAFITSAFICFLLTTIICWIGVLVLTIYPNIKKDDILRIMIFEHDWIFGFRGIMFAGIMAMVMSTVDSYINSSSILLVHDLRQSISKNVIKNELRATRICSIGIGLISVLFAIRSGSYLDIVIWASMFYMPVVTVPFIMAIIGFRSSSKSVLIGMGMGFATAIIWEIYFKAANIGGVLPGMFVNLICLIGSHYLLKQPGGWRKNNTRNNITIDTNGEGFAEQKQIVKKNFNIIEFLKKNTPQNEAMVALLGLFVMVSSFISANALPRETYQKYMLLLDIIYPCTISFTTALISYPLWSSRNKNAIIMPLIWNIGVFFVLICSSFLAVILSNFSEVQLMVFMANIIIISTVMKWQAALSFITIGTIITLLIYESTIDHLQSGNASLEFKVAYLVLLIISISIISLKPKQEQLEKTEAKVDGLEEEVDNLGNVVGSLNSKITDLNDAVTHYSERVQDQQQEIERLGSTAQKILNNVNHELRLPVGNVMNFAEMLSEGLEKFNKTQLKMLSDEVFQNSNRLSTMILNMLDLATLDAKKIELQKQTINLSEMVSDRVKNCRKVYLQDKQIDFEMTIEPEILISVDPNYMRQTIDNLVINAITYSNSGVIKVSVLRKGKNMVELTIKDQGIGIPKGELYDIFTPFKMGTNTESKAQGRGVGLALCKSAIEAHGGSISVESDGNGATFRVVLTL